ncbi:MAG: phosphoethanolamine methyltransferase, partial [Deltaproteobacteria bacterium]|nr:phosphoethanolamine methyltransferase [Deltaproteobacteria bacterium]
MTDSTLAVNAKHATSRIPAIVRHFNRDDKVLVIISADPDSISSAVALKRLLWRRVAHVTVCSTNDIRRPDNLRLLEALKLPLPSLSTIDTETYTKLVM